jgi:hypothetical protein
MFQFRLLIRSRSFPEPSEFLVIAPIEVNAVREAIEQRYSLERQHQRRWTDRIQRHHVKDTVY